MRLRSGDKKTIEFHYGKRQDVRPARIEIENLGTGAAVTPLAYNRRHGDSFRPAGSREMKYEWDTDGLAPGSYRIYIRPDGAQRVAGATFVIR